ncbi:MAG: response regulator [Planctomycetes bacterium]|nr:response regulator [Planctomycetota bacterium]
MKILIVDDSLAARSFIARMLTKQGHECVMASHGGEALERLTSEEVIELALVDWNMPFMNGLELVKAVRANSRRRDLPMLMVTSECELERVALAFEAGADEYLMKPFTDVELSSKIQLALASRAGTK